ncbi:hypothetical protein SAY86_008024 [Trapa natans]|uniref:Uncharacterized protein n=1 Tax=Trapa natans TaxID=22666 RepID=A0AAN7R0Q0_TRANT|nr:hypothetical protein SAY86_008024 [Trapa natans]
MTTVTTTTETATETNRPAKLVCFSFASYARTLIGNLKSDGVPVLEGLTDVHLTFLESSLSISFPPDLRSILQEGIPVGPGFPDWRSTSLQQLQILFSLPRLTFLKLISENDGFWCASWGKKPDTPAEAAELAKRLAAAAPPLVPVYRNCYIASRPCMAGNPVFYLNGDDVRVLSFDLAGFFRDMEFTQKGTLRQRSGEKVIDSPAWAATAPRKIEFWSEAVEAGRWGAGGGCWWGGGGRVGAVLDEAFSRLRNGGWRLEEVREMMLMDGCDGVKEDESGPRKAGDVGYDGVVGHVRELSRQLLRGGWSREDIVDSLGVLSLDLDEDSSWRQKQPTKEEDMGEEKAPEPVNSSAGGSFRTSDRNAKARPPRHQGFRSRG